MSDIQAILQDLQAVAKAQAHVDKLMHAHIALAYKKVQDLSRQDDILINQIISALNSVRNSDDIRKLINQLQEHSMKLSRGHSHQGRDENVMQFGYGGEANPSNYSSSNYSSSDEGSSDEGSSDEAPSDEAPSDEE
jgi:hypothetical protein